MDITDDEIADIFSDKEAMILAADNATCDQINSFMATVQTGNSEIFRANYYEGSSKITATEDILKYKFDKVNHAIRLGPNCKVNLTINIDVELGLTNKTTGTVRKIVKSKDTKDAHIILVHFESWKGLDIVYDLDGNAYSNVVPIKVYTQSGKDRLKREN